MNYQDLKIVLEDHILPPRPASQPVTRGLEDALVALDNLVREHHVGSVEFQLLLNKVASLAMSERAR